MKQIEPLDSNPLFLRLLSPHTYSFPVNRSKSNQSSNFWKRGFDLFAILLSFPILIPLISLIGFFIWIEDGEKPFYVQMRTGLHGKRFRMFKFRTMVSNAEQLKQELQHLNVLEYPDFKIPDDPRITKIGRFLRKTSLDELPQLVNVFFGEMSLVGPRPTSFKPETYKSWHHARLEATPGLTGLWQVSGRSDLEFDDRVKLDIEYIENQTLLFDIKILLQTVGSVFNGRGAY